MQSNYKLLNTKHGKFVNYTAINYKPQTYVMEKQFPTVEDESLVSEEQVMSKSGKYTNDVR